MAFKVLQDLQQDNFYDEMYLKEKEESEYYERQEKEKLQKIKENIKTQFVRDLLNKSEKINEETLSKILKEMEKTDDNQIAALMEDYKQIEKLYEE